MDTILYVGGSDPAGDPLGLLDRVPDARRTPDGAVAATLPGGARPRRVIAASEPEAAAHYLREHPVDALVLDTRVAPFRAEAPNPSEPGPFAGSRTGRMLDRLYPEGALMTGMPRDRVIGVVGEGRRGAEAAYHLGHHRLGTVLVAPALDEVAARLEAVLERYKRGRIAICLAGGGIEGLLYEVGVLRALDAFLVDRPVVDVDLFCGISAGAVLGGLLANGMGPDEIARGLSHGTARLDPVRRADLFDPNWGELGWRLGRLAADVVRGGSGPRGLVSSLGRSVPSGLFAGNRLRSYLRRQLERPGMSDRFGDLRRPLFVGATDQDTGQAVVFGEEGLTHVPIHRAVRASAALAPFYSPERIDGRYYVDGAFSRTTNMRVAVRQGATLVILIDPLVPVFSPEAGYVHARGGLFGTLQGLKGLINQRFDKAVHALAEMFPDVSFWLFRPESNEMRILSGSPMKYFYRREVEEVAFESSARKMREWLPEMQRDFARHGVTFRDPEARVARPKEPEPLEPSALGVGT
ncbi:MAG: patatin-like phospholipase family protein [Myxococcota bacterium]